MAARVTPTDRESHFQLEEQFFSTTDRKGFITFGNDVFVRVSRYAQEELLGQPHNIIRHPDMPRCVFRVLWDYILAGKPIAAYVKNMAKDGSYYWVLAFVVPIPEGFLSIRMKPTGPIFDKIGQVYAVMRAAEQQADDAGLSRVESMDAGAAKLGEVLKSLGLADYDQLMHEIVISEVQSRRSKVQRSDEEMIAYGQASVDLTLRRQRCAAMSATARRLLGTMESFLDLEKRLGENTKFAISFGQTLRRLTMNGRIFAASLGSQAAALCEVARQMNVVSVEVAEAGEDLSRTMSALMGCLKRASAEIATSDISVEMMAHFLLELQLGGVDVKAVGHNIDELAFVINERFKSVAECTQVAGRDLAALTKILDRFLLTMQTLDMIYVSGRIESVRCAGADDFNEMLCQTVAVADDARKRIDALQALVRSVQGQLVVETARQRETDTMQRELVGAG